ncbi:sugar transferase [Pseudoalteromonas sp. OOF1S-7]|uniref:sugar transferase n=1 Tax=Pseudoalteromonas sp. OOF1S-7 TaxID=2917757 RepID=UPI001EF5A46E|nr:sugar transferase [Pseudoalteromonas sp. OOF1S-7]
MYSSFIKRFSDIFLSICAFIILSPLLAVVAVLICLFDPGPLIFTQQRIGRNGVQFKFYKFRSMPVNTGDIPSDKVGQVKLTWVGKLIRRTNIDELPQLFNIFKGDMSIVGPRPPIASQVELIEARKANGAIAVRPGLTGLAQIKAFDGMSVAQKAEFDSQYAARITFFGDVKIILNTVAYLFRPPPVY